MPPLDPPCCPGLIERLIQEGEGRGLGCKNVPVSKDLGLSESLATKLALDALENYKPEPIPSPCRSRQTSHLRGYPVQIFDVLDRTLFRGVLKGQVYLRWHKMQAVLHGVTARARPGRDQRITIFLHRILTIADPSVVLTVLVHHMAHAYYLVCCGFRDTAGDVEKHDLGHGLCYGTLLHRIKEVFRSSEGLKIIDLPQFLNDRASRAQLHLAMSRRQVADPRSGHSCCQWIDQGPVSKEACHVNFLNMRRMKTSDLIGDKKINPYPSSHYLHKVDLKKPSFVPVLRAQYSFNPDEEIELHYSSYAIAFSRKKLKTFSFWEAHDGKPALAVPAPSDAVFFAFYAFLLNGDYHPELAPTTSPYYDAAKSNGPPAIATFKPDDPLYLITDIRVYIFACKMSFPELKRKALDRMWAMSLTHNNPITVLEEIYGDNGLSNQDVEALQHWSLVFLRKFDTATKLANILVLQQSAQWSEPLQALRRKNFDLNHACVLALRCLVLEKAVRTIKNGMKVHSLKEDERELIAGKEKMLAQGKSDMAAFRVIRTMTWSDDADQFDPPVSASGGAYSSLSTAELLWLKGTVPKLAKSYEDIVSAQKEAEKQAKANGKRDKKHRDAQRRKQDKRKAKPKARARANGTYTDDEYDSDGDSSDSSSYSLNQFDESDGERGHCRHRCRRCVAAGSRACRHFGWFCQGCGERRRPSRRYLRRTWLRDHRRMH